MRKETGEERKGGKRLWEEDMLICFSFSLLLSESGRLLMGRRSSLRIEAVVPRKVPRLPPPCWIVFVFCFVCSFLAPTNLM